MPRATALRVLLSGVVDSGGAKVVSRAVVGRTRVVAFARSVLDHPACRVLISVASVLGQLMFGLLEAFRLALASFRERSFGLARVSVGRRWLGTHAAADCAGLSCGGGFLLVFQIAGRRRLEIYPRPSVANAGGCYRRDANSGAVAQ